MRAMKLMLAIVGVLLSSTASWAKDTISKTNSAKLDKALQEAHTEEVAWKYVPLSGPAVDAEFSGNVSTQIGKTALLNCRIKYGGGKTVSWMRTRDLHLLTVGRFTYTSDDRFKAIHQSGSHDWLLKIHYVQKRDQGGYECQVSTNPPLSYTVWLQVVEPETRILGARDLHIHVGSNINLTCVVRHSPKAPAYMLWYHGKQVHLIQHN
ncbi:uncharacterized protein LOC108670981 [Hyalella azteca]|uniref:Uncharacterized protein LOC108670981 n=1 Tax=Hyalella azteca TaxID=294128 RepID=A0A8B7NL11_HYAAZ|nr:uncharacterized protein LOC108670981 [Hyalella azteca]